MTTTSPTAGAPLARTLRPLYLARFGFAVLWAIAVVLLVSAPAALVILLVLYPLVDAAAVLIELRAGGGSRVSAVINLVLDVAAAVTLGIVASTPDPVPAVLVTWGVWAVVAGAMQLVTALVRRRAGGQWPLVISGAISVLAGSGFLMMGLKGGDSLTVIAGYAVAGGVFFLVSGVRLLVAGRRARA